MSWYAAAFCIISLMVSVHAETSSQRKCDPPLSVAMPNAHVMGNGSAWDPDDLAEYAPGTFWTEDGEMFGCPCMQGRPCLRKCCPRDQAMDFNTLRCVPHNETVHWFRPKLPVDPEGNTRVADFGEFGIVYGNYCLGYLLEPAYYPEDNFTVDFSNGTLTKVGRSLPEHQGYQLGPEDFCLDYFPRVNDYLPYLCINQGAIKERDACEGVRYILYPSGMVISIVFLVASLVVYAIEPKLRNLCGKCMMFYMVSLLCSYVSLATVQGLGKRLSDDVCTCFGFIIYFSLLCTFFWLNVLCIDITLAFRPSPVISGNPAARDKKKLIYYSLYAWGVPLLITTVTLIAELHPGVSDSILKPSFHLTCWFYETSTKFVYFILPVGIIVLCNLGLFIFTARNIYVINKVNQQCKTKKEKRRCTKADKKRLRLYVKLYVVMGVTWILEIASFFIGGSSCIWLFTDMLNTLQGLFIFLILICNQRVVGLLRKRLCHKMAAADDPVTRLNSTSEEEEDDDLPTTTSTSTDAAEGQRGNEFRLKSKASPEEGISKPAGGK